MAYDYYDDTHDDCDCGYCPECLGVCLEYDEVASYVTEVNEHHVFVCPSCGFTHVDDYDLTEPPDVSQLPKYER